MKEKLKIITITIIVIGIIVCGATACKKKDKDQGGVIVRMTDAPAAFSEVNVEITGMQINHEGAGWIDVPVKKGVYNLLDLQNNVSVVLVDNVKLPVGKVNQMRLMLGTNNSVKEGTVTYPLTVPSGAETGLKININQEISYKNTIDIMLDFDANASIVVEGNGKFSLKPVIKIKSVTQI